MAHQLGQPIEITLGAHAEDHLLRLVSHRVAGIGIDRRRLIDVVRLAILRERAKIILRLQRVHFLVILLGASRIGAAEDQDIAGRDVDPGHARGNLALPAGTGQQIARRLAAGRPRARRGDHRHPEAVSGEEVIAIAHVGVREDPRLLVEIHPGDRIERVGIGCRNAAIVGRRVALDVEELAHGRMQAFGLSTLVICTRVTSVVISE